MAQHLPLHPTITIALAVVIWLTPGCTTASTVLSPSDPSWQRISDALETTSLSPCEHQFLPEWNSSSLQRNLQVMQIHGRNVLVYDLVSRGSVRTVWQPLDDRLAFDGDGRTLGHEGSTHTLDFRFAAGKGASLWTSYRYKSKGNPVAAAAIEWLQEDTNAKLVRLHIPSHQNETIQDLWLLPSDKESDGVANVITRSYRYSNKELSSDWDESDASIVYSWYHVNAIQKTVSQKGTFQDAAGSIQSIKFVATGSGSEPLAVLIEQETHKNSNASGKEKSENPIRHSRIVARKLFGQNQSSATLYTAENSVFGMLDVLATATDEANHLAIAWSKSSESTTKTTIQWLQITADPKQSLAAALFSQPNGQSSGPQLAKRTKQDDKADGTNKETTSRSSHTDLGFALKRSQGSIGSLYPPTDLKLRPHPTAKPAPMPATFLTWLATSATESAFMSLALGTEGTSQDTSAAIPPNPKAQAHVIKAEGIRHFGVSGRPGPEGRIFVIYRRALSASASKGSQEPASHERSPLEICSVSLVLPNERTLEQ